MTDSVTTCAFTTDPTDAPLFRLAIEPSKGNGLRAICRLMVDKITTVPKTKIGTRIGRLDDEDMVRALAAVGRGREGTQTMFLGIAAPTSREKLK